MENKLKKEGEMPGENTINTNGTKSWNAVDSRLLASDSSLIFDNRIEREWLSTEEADHFLSVSSNALRIMVHRDQIAAYKFGRRLRFSVRDCQALFKKKGA